MFLISVMAIVKQWSKFQEHAQKRMQVPETNPEIEVAYLSHNNFTVKRINNYSQSFIKSYHRVIIMVLLAEAREILITIT